MLDKYYDELEVGDKSVTQGRTITEADIVAFAGITGDWYPLHVDKEYAARSPFKQRIAHGMLVLSVASGLSVPKTGVLIAFYGMDKVRFTNPTFIGDTLHVAGEIINKEDRGPDKGIITVESRVKNQRGETVVVSIMKALLNTKSAQ
ncbi:MAG: MaoC/PaaZ C-terminal domain-containing protein [Bacillota bacterium]